MRSIRLIAATTVVLVGAWGCGDGGSDLGDPPVANFTAASCTEDQPCQFTDASTPVNGITTWSWNFGDGTALDPNQNPLHTFADDGNFNVTLTVTNSDGSNAKTNTVVVAPATSGNVPPTAAFTGGPCTVNVACSFTDASIDTDGNIATWSWTFGDPLNGTSNLQHPSYTFQSEGTFNVTLTVTDNGGASSTPVTVPVTVSAAQAGQCSTVGTVARCTLTMTQRSTVNVTLTNVDCEITGNRVFEAAPRRDALWFNVCAKIPGEVKTITDATGGAQIFEAGTTLTLEFTQGSGIDPEDPVPTFPEMRAEGGFPNWTIHIDDGGAPQLPRNDDVLLTVTASPR